MVGHGAKHSIACGHLEGTVQAGCETWRRTRGRRRYLWTLSLPLLPPCGRVATPPLPRPLTRRAKTTILAHTPFLGLAFAHILSTVTAEITIFDGSALLAFLALSALIAVPLAAVGAIRILTAALLKQHAQSVSLRCDARLILRAARRDRDTILEVLGRRLSSGMESRRRNGQGEEPICGRRVTLYLAETS